MSVLRSYEERCKTYLNALIAHGDRHQMVVAVEELSEAQKEICKVMRGGEDFRHLAEEIADARICLEQMAMIFHLEDAVDEIMEAKVERLDERLRNGR